MNRRRIRIYLDTSVPSAYFDNRWPDRMDLTRKFWTRLDDYAVFVSAVAYEEIRRMKDKYPEKEASLLTLIEGIPVLPTTPEIERLADLYLSHGIIPVAHVEDALRLATATLNGADYLISWNFRHLVNVRTREKASALNALYGHPVVGIITPPELTGEE